MLGLVLTGCATQQPAVMPVSNTPQPITGGSSALAFDVPITFSEPPIEISRDDRGPAAFMGFDQPSTSYYDTFSYNRQSSDRSDRYVQESVTERIGSIQR
jgi:hypothetical protein